MSELKDNEIVFEKTIQSGLKIRRFNTGGWEIGDEAHGFSEMPKHLLYEAERMFEISTPKKQGDPDFPPSCCGKSRGSHRILFNASSNPRKNNHEKEKAAIARTFQDAGCQYYETFAVDPHVVGFCGYPGDENYMEEHIEELGQIYLDGDRPACCPWAMAVEALECAEDVSHD